MNVSDLVMIVVGAMQGVFGIISALLVSAIRDIKTSIKENTDETKANRQTTEDIRTTMHAKFATRDELTALGAKYDSLNREMGELSARVGYAVKHKEY